MAELKKCPFCGGDCLYKTFEVNDLGDEIPVIFCNWCKVVFKVENDSPFLNCKDTYKYLEEKNIKAWNNRATEAEIKAKAIDEFAEKLNKKITDFVLEHQNQLTFVSGVSMGWKFVDEIAEQLKGE